MYIDSEKENRIDVLLFIISLFQLFFFNLRSVSNQQQNVRSAEQCLSSFLRLLRDRQLLEAVSQW